MATKKRTSSPKVLGNYLVLSKIGQGGMGYVYKARHAHMDRVVAIKVLPRQAAKDPNLLRRFHREAQAAAKLSHPNVVSSFDADEVTGIHFIVMEFVDGMDLLQLVRTRGPLSWELALNYVLQAARGLQFAHNHGVIHRDIKPSNLLVDRDNNIKILDMGLARVEDEHAALSSSADLTEMGTTMGSIDYMSPEQAEDAHQADARSDIYSLGCTLWFLLNGKPVYTGNSITECLVAHIESPSPALTEIDRAIPTSLDRIFQKMIAKAPDDRYQSADDLLQDLERVSSRIPCWRTKTAAASAFAAIFLMIVWMFSAAKRSEVATGQHVAVAEQPLSNLQPSPATVNNETAGKPSSNRQPSYSIELDQTPPALFISSVVVNFGTEIHLEIGPTFFKNDWQRGQIYLSFFAEDSDVSVNYPIPASGGTLDVLLPAIAREQSDSLRVTRTTWTVKLHGWKESADHFDFWGQEGRITVDIPPSLDPSNLQKVVTVGQRTQLTLSCDEPFYLKMPRSDELISPYVSANRNFFCDIPQGMAVALKPIKKGETTFWCYQEQGLVAFSTVTIE